mgnify:CR=1 FL=1
MRLSARPTDPSLSAAHACRSRPRGLPTRPATGLPALLALTLTACDPDGVVLMTDAALAVIPEDATAIGGITVGADPVAYGIAAVAATRAGGKLELLVENGDWFSTATVDYRGGLRYPKLERTQAEPDRTLGPGELFPVGALSAGGTTTKVFHSLQDTTCLLLPREHFLALRRDSPEFERYCTQAITETLRQSLASLYSQYRQRAAEQQSLTRTLGELVRHAPVACTP